MKRLMLLLLLFQVSMAAWWDTDWLACTQINITGNFQANYSHPLILNSSVMNTSKVQSGMEDLRFFEGTCDDPDTTTGLLPQWNESVNTSANSYIWVRTSHNSTDIDSLAMYYNNSAASSIFDINSTFYLGRDVDNRDEDWTDAVGEVEMKDGGINMWIDLTDPELSDIGYWSITDLSPPFEYQCRLKTGDVTSNSASVRAVDGSVTNTFSQFFFPHKSVDSKAYLANATTIHELGAIDANTTYYIYKSQVNSTAFNGFQYYSNRTLIASNDTFTSYSEGSPTAMDKLAWHDSTSWPMYNDIYVTWCIVRPLYDDQFTEPTYSFGSEEGSGSTGVDDCTTISSSGRYVQTQNITTTGDCIIINADDVDYSCEGYQMDGDNSGDDTAFYVNGRNNVTIHNCPDIQQFQRAFEFIGTSSNITVENVTVDDTHDSSIIYVWSATTEVDIRDSVLEDSGLNGIYLEDGATNIRIDNVTIVRDYGDGINIEADNVNVTNCNISDGGGSGVVPDIYIGGNADNVLINNTDMGDGGSDTCIFVDGSGISGVTITYNRCTNGGNAGFHILGTGTSEDGVMHHNNITNTDETCIRLEGADGWEVYENICKNNSGDGISVYGTVADNNIIHDNIVNMTDAAGDSCFEGQTSSGTGNVFANNTGFDCVGDGIWLSGTTDWLINNNTIYNSPTGLNIIDSSSVSASDNHFYNNTVDFKANYSSSATGFSLANCIFDRNAGDFTDYVNLSISDTLSSGEVYTMDHATLPSTPPSDKEGIGIWLNITQVSGSSTIGTITWYYQESDVSGFNESTLDMYKWNGASWTELTDTLDTEANSLTVNNLASFSDFGPLGDPDFRINMSIVDTYETENETLFITLRSTVGDITAYNVSVYYNNTNVGIWNVTGASSSIINLNASVIAPLVASNLTAIPWNGSASVVIDGNPYSDTDAGNQSVELWYYLGAYTVTPDASYTVEGRNNFTVTIPTKPSSSPEDVTYSRSYTFPDCTWTYANGTASNETCGNSLVNDFMQNFSILPSHEYEDGLIYSDVWVNRTYGLAFDATTESESSKTLSEVFNATREYFVWITNSTNGSINGAGNMSNVFNATFYDEQNLSGITIDSVIDNFIVTFEDGQTKNYTIAYSGTLTESLIRGYPDFYNATVSSTEIYSKTGYTTRSRFLISAITNLSIQQNISLYFLQNSEASYAVINVVDNGEPVQGAYIQILKYYATSGLYLNIDQKVTNNQGQAPAYIEPDAYYKFVVYDSDGESVYESTQPEQFILDSSGIYSITINIAGASTLDFIGPYPLANCYGNETTNAIIFSYGDYTGATESVRFLAWRSDFSYGDAVCNQSITGSSGGYTCSLSGGENLSLYPYLCGVYYTASPEKPAFFAIIDFVNAVAQGDWVIVAVMMTIGLGTVGVSSLAFGPIIGIIALGVGLGAMYALDLAPINQSFVVPVLIAGALLIFVLGRRGDD